MRRRRASKRHEVAELNVTAFMNLMVVLVPFLLITAVFSRLTILELNLPSDNAQTSPPSKGLNLELSITQGDISADVNSKLVTPKSKTLGSSLPSGRSSAVNPAPVAINQPSSKPAL